MDNSNRNVHVLVSFCMGMTLSGEHSAPDVFVIKLHVPIRHWSQQRGKIIWSIFRALFSDITECAFSNIVSLLDYFWLIYFNNEYNEDKLVDLMSEWKKKKLQLKMEATLNYNCILCAQFGSLRCVEIFKIFKERLSLYFIAYMYRGDCRNDWT